MLKRKILNRLIDWKTLNEKKCLIIEGVRQVGKTYIVNYFGENYYEDYIYINFELDKSKKMIFDGDITKDEIYTRLSLLYRNNFQKKSKKLLFLDEIQACPNAITALKSLAMEDRFDTIASGSLLGVHYNQVSSFPVGYVDRLTMYPLDFEEFLWANDIEESPVNSLKDCFDKKKQVPEIIHQEMLKIFRQYIAVGGMPEIVQDFINNKDYNQVLKNQNRILEDYRSDIAKYATKKEKVKARECFESIPFQLGKDNKKFQYKYVSKGGRSSIYETSIQWLIDAGIVLKCNNLSKPEIPLITNKRIDAFKLYFSDIGLLVSMLGESAQTKILFGDLGVSKGAVYENVIAALLKQNGYDLYYFEKDTRFEIDFIIEKDNEVTGIEVKSGDNTRSKSLKSFINNYFGDKAIKLSTKNCYFTEKEIRLPLYMIMFI